MTNLRNNRDFQGSNNKDYKKESLRQENEVID